MNERIAGRVLLTSNGRFFGVQSFSGLTKDEVRPRARETKLPRLRAGVLSLVRASVKPLMPVLGPIGPLCRRGCELCGRVRSDIDRDITRL